MPSGVAAALRPLPVSFSRREAPPISAAEERIITLAMPQSEPRADGKVSALHRSLVKIDYDNPCGTALYSCTGAALQVSFTMSRASFSVLIGARDVGVALVDHPQVPLISATWSPAMGHAVGPRIKPTVWCLRLQASLALAAVA